jgi:flagellar M-ring protein FliF
VLGFVAVLIIFMVLRPLAGRLTSLPAAPGAGVSADAPAQLPGPAEGRPQLPHSSAAAKPDAQPNESVEEESMIDINRVEGRVRASTVRKIGEIVEKHPEEALSIVRTWLYEAS